jgi:hypothetical protein
VKTLQTFVPVDAVGCCAQVQVELLPAGNKLTGRKGGPIGLFLLCVVCGVAQKKERLEEKNVCDFFLPHTHSKKSGH